MEGLRTQSGEVMKDLTIRNGSKGSQEPEQNEQGDPQGKTSSGRRQGVSQGTMRRPRLSTWRLFLWETTFF